MYILTLGCSDTLWYVLYAPAELITFWAREPVFLVINQPQFSALGESRLSWLSCLPQSCKTDGALVRESEQLIVPRLRQVKNPQPVI